MSKLKRRTKWVKLVKYLFFRYGIHKILPGTTLSFFGHLSQLSKWISQNRNLQFSTFPSRKYDYQNRYKLYRYIIDHEIKDEVIDYLEFGVATGVSFRWWIEQLQNNDCRFYGFDTFTGLPEDWGPFKKGDLSNGNKLPEINDNRHFFYQGIFQDTLYKFLDSYENKRRKLIHLDADLYSSTLFVLTTLSPYLRKGDLLLFDEFNVPLHEFKAFNEWANSFYIKYTVLGEVNNYFQVLIRID